MTLAPALRGPGRAGARRAALLAALLGLSGCGPLVQARSDAPAAGCPAPAAAPAPVPARPIPGLRVGLALGSGSMHGLAHIGVIEALEARGVAVQVVAGTSVGALIGGLWASGLEGRRIEALSRQASWQDEGTFSASGNGIMSNAGLRDELERVFGGRPIESWPRRFGAVATDLANGHTRVLMAGDGAKAIQASTAVPVLYAPVSVGGERLGDGALVEPVPVGAARALGADFVIAVDVAYRPYEEPASGIAGYGFQAMHILVNNLAAEQMKRADFPLRLDLHHELVRCGPGSLIAAGREAMDRAWPQLARALAERAGKPAHGP